MDYGYNVIDMTEPLSNGDSRVRVAYIDDQLLFREALASVLETSGSVTVVHSGKQDRAVVRALKELSVGSLLIALDMQHSDPMALLQEVRISLPDLGVCALVAVDRLERAREAIGSGCRGAVSTAATLPTLIAALEAIAGGQAYVDATLGGRLLAKSISHAGRNNHRSGSRSTFVTKPSEISKN